MRRKLIEGVFWGAVIGTAFAAGLIGVPGFGVVLLIVFAAFAGIIRLKLLAWAFHRMRPQS